MDNTNLYGIGIFLPHERKVAKYTKEDIVTAARVRLRDGAPYSVTALLHYPDDKLFTCVELNMLADEIVYDTYYYA